MGSYVNKIVFDVSATFDWTDQVKEFDPSVTFVSKRGFTIHKDAYGTPSVPKPHVSETFAIFMRYHLNAEISPKHERCFRNIADYSICLT